MLGAVGLVQALLTALGAANGGFSAVLLNDRWLFFLGLVFVVIGFGVGAIHLQRTGKRGWRAKAVAGMATVCLLLGVLGTAYAAIAAPSLTSDPTVNISLTGGAHPLLRVSVTASGIPRSQTLQVEVGALTIGANGLLHEVGPPLYHAELGANLQGEIATTISMPIPPPRQYSSINVEAWTGSVHHFCGFPTTTEPAVTSRPAHEGCALVQVAGT